MARRLHRPAKEARSLAGVKWRPLHRRKIKLAAHHDKSKIWRICRQFHFARASSSDCRHFPCLAHSISTETPQLHRSNQGGNGTKIEKFTLKDVGGIEPCVIRSGVF